MSVLHEDTFEVVLMEIIAGLSIVLLGLKLLIDVMNYVLDKEEEDVSKN